ncbi:DUF805 domain-containing protein [Sphingomonas sp. BK235]|uniref:DUF805 domain-containing protein n=1 Tax=Sphingomonas sp. BK235 TaxID=2512131 RepID=UPI0010F2049F|nr:DUF805 domain-containing protein [Sphingomonas sp. BK235]TCP33773.1 uncharacterized membrane protein YhaH (DUF805 family) [Sphingomonas sp. BK235]
MDEWIRPWRRYAETHGRASRREYLAFHAGAALVLAVAVVVAHLAEDAAAWLIATLRLGESNAAALLLFALMLLPLLVALLLLIPSLAVSLRRLRDLGRSPRWLVLLALPFGGIALALALALLPSPRGAAPTATAAA